MRIDAEMALHDADMTRFGQWWRRSRRAGHAYAEGAALHGRTAERFNVRHVRSAVFWGLIAPLAAVVTACAALAAVAWVWLGLVFWAGGYGLLMLRIYRHRRRRGDSARFALLYAAFCVLAKVPQCVGVLQYHLDRLRDRRPALIEYKDLPPSHAVGADKVR